MFSALKHKGKPLYKLARKGIEIERKLREINISLIELLDFDGLGLVQIELGVVNVAMIAFFTKCWLTADCLKNANQNDGCG